MKFLVREKWARKEWWDRARPLLFRKLHVSYFSLRIRPWCDVNFHCFNNLILFFNVDFLAYFPKSPLGINVESLSWKQLLSIKTIIIWFCHLLGRSRIVIFRVEISALSVIQNSIRVKRAVHDKIFNPGLKFWWVIRACVHGSDYLLQENKTNAFLLPGIDAENLYYIAFQPRGWNRPCNRKKFQPV
jgi:hypothetical protein